MTPTRHRAIILSLTAVFVLSTLASGDPFLLSPDWDFESDQATAFLGNAVAGAGDVNGDGYDDVLIAASSFTDDQNNEGRVWLFYGGENGLADTAAWFADGNLDFAEFGWSVAGAGDVNNDDFDDVIIGSYFYSNGENREGRAFLYLGSESGLADTAAWTAEGNQNIALFGYSVAGAGDVNNDGHDDVIVGAFVYDDDFDDEGRAYVYLGNAGGLADTAVWVMDGDQMEAGFGVNVGGAGDINNDGYDDIIVGASGYENPEPDEGQAFLYLGSESGPETVPAWTFDSDQDGAALGVSVGAAGDVNGDTYDDVIVGAYRWDLIEEEISSGGKAYVFFGSDSGLSVTEDWSAVNDIPAAEFGFATSSAGDVDGNGFDDVIVGAVGFELFDTDNGGIFLYMGSDSGLADMPLCIATVEDSLARFGYSVACAGDVNMDGFSDVLAGALLYDNPEVNEGRAFAFYGSAAAGVPFPTGSRPPTLLSYPNPSPSRTRVVYSLESRQDVRYTIHDLQGRSVREIVRLAQAPGNHRISWDGRNARGERVAPGIYFGRLVANGGIQRVKIVLE